MMKAFPFAALVGQDDMKRALTIAAIDPTVGGVLIFGDRGTGKSTAVRALADLLPPISVADGDVYNRKPEKGAPAAKVPVPVVDLPLGATEDRVVGALDLESALARGEKRFEPGLLARANRGFLYIDEINLLEDHLVDLLLDVAASGENIVEREGLSVRHDARFVLIGSGNPEEGELRPQLLDRFGLAVDVLTPTDIDQRVEAVRRRDAYERDCDAFCADWADETAALSRQIAVAQKRLARVAVADKVLKQAAQLCVAVGTDGLRGELTLIRAARAFAALEGAKAVSLKHLRAIATMALGHRLRRDPLDEAGAQVRVERALAETFAS